MKKEIITDNCKFYLKPRNGKNIYVGFEKGMATPFGEIDAETGQFQMYSHCKVYSTQLYEVIEVINQISK